LRGKKTNRQFNLKKIAAEGRQECHGSVKSLMNRELETLAPKIAEQIWTSVKPFLGERQRS